jgi:MoxR-like ATPase
MATQNPSEHYGTFPLPDSQMDRFMLNISMGYPIKDEEIKILKKGSVRKKLDKIVPLISKEEIFKIKEKIDSVYTSEKVLSYIVDIVNATRKNKFLITGVSPRCSLAIMQCCKALAYFNSRDYISPEDVKVLAPFVVSHRIIFRDEYSSIEKKELVCEIVENVSVPV